MPRKKSKRFGKLPYSVSAGNTEEAFRSNARLVEKVLARRKAKGQRPDTNGYIHVEGVDG